ncbi:substrate-binding periplasmic protein [Spartinivicinus poritis]|uniref:Transporter substrate-binding domain-containing protein n=1 Tax=Spartinivicinus poritis TaxID=2994640 RepID=A0ABT5UKX3_9GAMM|nr:transporter substrate-binding domain-containing protein [Spartinivicinus sp. A2-2]MDE1465689.1 transporter substrate-binding domain-containing protein [Spartinivicinus sp. A2-2]
MRILLIIIEVMLTTSLISKLYAEQTLRIATGEFPPYNSKSLKHGGLMPHIIKEAFAIAGYKAQFEFYPWKRAYQMSADGIVDATAQWLDSKERRKHHFYSDPIVEERTTWIYLKETTFDWDSYDDLKKYRIAAITGYTYTPEFYDAVKNKNIKVQFVLRLDQSLRLVLEKRVDLTLEDMDVAYFKLRKLFPENVVAQFTTHSKPVQISYNHLLISKAKPDAEKVLKLFNYGLHKLKEKGVINKYIDNSRKGLY